MKVIHFHASPFSKAVASFFGNAVASQLLNSGHQIPETSTVTTIFRTGARRAIGFSEWVDSLGRQSGLK